MNVLRALARVVVAGVDLVVTAVRTQIAAERAYIGLRNDRLVRMMEDEIRKADTVSFIGLVDPFGQWREDLAAGRIDHAGNRLPLPTAPESPSRAVAQRR